MNDDKRTRTLHRAFEQYIAGSRMRSTPERLAILDAVSRQKGRFGTRELTESLASLNFKVSRATLYNTLSMLQEAGIVARRPAVDGTGDTTAMWEVTEERNRVGFTLVCTVCGRRRAARDPSLARQLLSRRFATFMTTGVEVCISGLCSRCRKKQTI